MGDAPHSAGRRQALAAEVRRRLGPPPQRVRWPLVSIVVPSRNGCEDLRRLVAGLAGRTDYPAVELIVVDNASEDGSLEFLRAVEAPFPITIVANAQNESFSHACNQGAELADGELLLLLNNDVEPFEPAWLRELVACLSAGPGAAVAATLVCPDSEHKTDFEYGFGVQHRGLGFREGEGGAIVPALHGWEADPLDRSLGVDIERAAVAAACLLVELKTFERVGGFSHGYVYGVEDVDFCLKLGEAGCRVFCSGRSLAIHNPASSRRAAPFAEQRARTLANRRLLLERWGPRLRREFELDRLAPHRLWAEPEVGPSPFGRAEIDALAICIKSAGSAEEPVGLRLDGDLTPTQLSTELRLLGHRAAALGGAEAVGLAGMDYDVAVHLRGRLRFPLKLSQLNVLWSVSHFEALTAIECANYDLVLCVDDDAALRLQGEGLPPTALAGLDESGAAPLAGSLLAAVEAWNRQMTRLRTRVIPI